MRSYPVPQPLQASLGVPSMRLPEVRAVAVHPDSRPAEREWAWRVLDSDRERVRSALTACGCGGSEDDREYYGICDPDSGPDTLVIAVVSLDDDGELKRWNGSGWDSVPDELEPVGYPFVAIDDDDLLADAIGTIGGGGSLLLRPTSAKTRVRGGLTADGSSAGVYAVVDDFDGSAVLDLFRVGPDGMRRRSGGAWVRDPALVGRLRGVDPPHVVEVPEDQVDRVTSSVDEYDRAHPATPMTAAAWDEALHPRAGGKFAPKDSASSASQQQPAAAPVGGQQAATGDYILTGKGRPSWVANPAAKKAVAKKAVAKKKAVARRPHTVSQIVQPTEVSKLQDQWASEDAKYADSDAKYDIARSKSDLAETQRRDAEDDSVKSEYDKANHDLANDPVALNDAIAKLNDRVRQETKRRTSYDRSSRYEATSEKIRRAERRRNLSATRAVAKSRAKRQDQATNMKRQLLRQRAQMAANAALAHPKKAPAKAAPKLPVKAAANPPAHTRMPNTLEDYWARGKGAAKIRWGTHGDFNRCRRHLAKYLRPDQIPGACANLHKLATGEWPGRKAHGGRKKALRSSGESSISVAGLAVVAADTGRVLMLQRALDPDDPASGMWELPGGHLESGEDPEDGAMREWMEETGCPRPYGQMSDTWTAPNGFYQGFVMRVPEEEGLDINRDLPHTVNPDDPDGDLTETTAWWDPEHLKDNPSVRPEVADTLDLILPAISGGGSR